MDKSTKEMLEVILKKENTTFKKWQDQTLEAGLMAIFMRKGEEFQEFKNWIIEREAQKKLTQFLSTQLNVSNKNQQAKNVYRESEEN